MNEEDFCSACDNEFYLYDMTSCMYCREEYTCKFCINSYEYEDWISVLPKCITCKKVLCRDCCIFCFECAAMCGRSEVYCPDHAEHILKLSSCDKHDWYYCGQHKAPKCGYCVE